MRPTALEPAEWVALRRLPAGGERPDHGPGRRSPILLVTGGPDHRDRITWPRAAAGASARDRGRKVPGRPGI